MNVLLISCSSICVSPFTEDFYSSISSVCVFVNHLNVCVDVGALRLMVTIHLAILCARISFNVDQTLLVKDMDTELFWSKPYQSNTSKYISQKSCKTNCSLILYKPLFCWKHILIAITPLTYSTHVSSCFVERFEQQETFTIHTRHPYELLKKTARKANSSAVCIHFAVPVHSVLKTTYGSLHVSSPEHSLEHPLLMIWFPVKPCSEYDMCWTCFFIRLLKQLRLPGVNVAKWKCLMNDVTATLEFSTSFTTQNQLYPMCEPLRLTAMPTLKTENSAG